MKRYEKHCDIIIIPMRSRTQKILKRYLKSFIKFQYVSGNHNVHERSGKYNTKNTPLHYALICIIMPYYAIVLVMAWPARCPPQFNAMPA